MDFQEFPKLLYRGGDILSDYVIVYDEAQEDEAEGFEAANLDVDQAAPAPAKRGRKPKAE